MVKCHRLIDKLISSICKVVCPFIILKVFMFSLSLGNREGEKQWIPGANAGIVKETKQVCKHIRKIPFILIELNAPTHKSTSYHNIALKVSDKYLGPEKLIATEFTQNKNPLFKRVSYYVILLPLRLWFSCHSSGRLEACSWLKTKTIVTVAVFKNKYEGLERCTWCLS